MPRDDAAIVDILMLAREALAFLDGMTCDEFLVDKKTQAAVLYHMLVIGEASKRLSVEFRADRREVPWVKIGNLRNILAHDYNRVDLKRIWGIATTELPLLVDRLLPLLPPQEPAEPQA